MRLEGRDIAVERADGGEHQRSLGQIAGIAHQVAGGEIVGAVGDDVVAGDDVERVAGVDARVVGLDPHVRIELGNGLLRARNLGGTDVRRVVHDLALQVVERDAIVIDDAEGADAGSGEIHEQRRAQTARADHEHLGRLELLLPLAAHLAQHQVPLVALDFFGGEDHLPCLGAVGLREL